MTNPPSLKMWFENGTGADDADGPGCRNEWPRWAERTQKAHVIEPEIPDLC